MSGSEKMKSHCNHCSTETHHRILHKEKTSWSEEIDYNVEICGGDTYIMLACNGCDNVKLLRRSWFSEDMGEDGHPSVAETSYPPATDRRTPDWFHTIQDPFDFEGVSDATALQEMLSEIYVACQNDQRRLATMGVRALFEHIMIMKVGDNGNFASNLGKFLEERYISKSQKEVLEAVLEAGHAAMHRFYKPAKKDLRTVVDIIENLIQTVVVHEKQAAELAKRVPARKPKALPPASSATQAEVK